MSARQHIPPLQPGLLRRLRRLRRFFSQPRILEAAVFQDGVVVGDHTAVVVHVRGTGVLGEGALSRPVDGAFTGVVLAPVRRQEARNGNGNVDVVVEVVFRCGLLTARRSLPVRLVLQPVTAPAMPCFSSLAPSVSVPSCTPRLPPTPLSMPTTRVSS